MSVDLVSEVDRRFFANNLLTNEDWESGMDQFNDISDLLGMDATMSPENLSQLPDELLSLDGSCSPLDLTGTRGLPMDDITFDHVDGEPSLDDPKLDYGSLGDTAVEEYWNEQEHQSDSSDSGIFSVNIKQEPPSPVSSNCSDAGSDGYASGSLSSSSSASAFAFTPAASTEDTKPTLIINTTNGLFPLQTSNININSILNSKIKIQPKPSDKAATATTSQTKSQKQTVKVTSQNGKPLVLSGEEFARLTATGALRFQPPAATATETKEVTSPCKSVPTPKPVPTPASVTPTIMAPIQVDNENKAIKRQQRMIKNRESASLSRKRKKEYLSGLEDRLKQFTHENQKLKQENDCLKRKLTVLQSENEKLKKTSPLTPAKRTCLLTLLIVFSFNIGPLSDLVRKPFMPSPSVSQGSIVHHGRQLLSVQENTDTYSDDLHPRWKNRGESLLRKLQELSEDMGWNQSKDKLNQTQFESLMCPTFFNKTESIRLAEQLAGWMIKHEEEKKSQETRRQKKKKEIRPVKTLKKALRGDFSRLERQEVRSADPGYQLQVFDGAEKRQNFLDAIHRRNDTFYVLSFNTDYLLVPASAHNKTMRPRMSLVMPVMGQQNETMQPPPGSIGMMQIDCEVLSTQYIHVHKSVVPPSTYSAANNTHSGTNTDDTWKDQA